MDITANCNVNELFDFRDRFQSRVFDVCMARNDLVMLNRLMVEHQNDTDFTFVFIFRQQIAIVREVLHLVYKLFDEHKEEISGLNSSSKIYDSYSMLLEDTDNLRVDKKSLLKEFLIPVRNQIYHYKDDTKEEPQYANIACCQLQSQYLFSDDMSLKNYLGRQYQFVYDVFLNSAMNRWASYRELSNDNLLDLAKDFSEYFGKLVPKIISLLDAIFDGYCQKYLDIEKTGDNYQIVRKKSENI